MTVQTQNTPFALIILDGWGVAAPSRGNAFTGADIPYYRALIRNYPCYLLAASGEAVGLPWSEPGNSEVGHLNLGAGKIVYQPVLRINKSIEDESFFANNVLAGAISHCKQHNSSLHLMGLVSDGGVHSHQDHLYALLEMAARSAWRRVYIHIFLDGRDSGFNSGLNYVRQLEKITKRLGVGTIATVSGRFWAMDRDNHWERIEKVYRAMVKGESAEKFTSAAAAIEASYAKKVYDEEFAPAVITDADGQLARVQPGDGMIFFNYRPDRARELAKAFVLPTFAKFERSTLGNLYFATLTEYEPGLPVRVAFPPETVATPLARVISENNLSQLHIAETEKYAHITYFLNGGSDATYAGQDNIIVPSLGTASYADKPEMSAADITKQTVADIKRSGHDVYMINLANADMVAHTGNLSATRVALAHADKAVRAITDAILAKGGSVVITADHGNAEEMVNPSDGNIIKEHSAYPVPCVIVSPSLKLAKPRADDFDFSRLSVSGVLSDATPTMLKLLGIKPPKEMTARPLL